MTLRVPRRIEVGRRWRMSTNGRTGIEISPGVSEIQRATEEMLHALHLDWFGALVRSTASATTMGIRVDQGERREEPWAGTHFVACAPGERELELDWNTHSIGGRSLRPLKAKVIVEPGRVTEVVYIVQQASTHGLAAASLEITGTRAA